MNYIFAINSGFRFILEIVSIIILLWLGFTKFKFPYNFCIGIFITVACIFLWSIYVAPASIYRAGFLLRFIIELTIFISIGYLISYKISRNLGIYYLIFSLLNNTISHWRDYYWAKQ